LSTRLDKRVLTRQLRENGEGARVSVGQDKFQVQPRKGRPLSYEANTISEKKTESKKVPKKQGEQEP